MKPQIKIASNQHVTNPKKFIKHYLVLLSLRTKMNKQNIKCFTVIYYTHH